MNGQARELSGGESMSGSGGRKCPMGAPKGKREGGYSCRTAAETLSVDLEGKGERKERVRREGGQNP